MSAFEEGKGAHTEAGQAPGARVSRDVVSGHCRAGEDKLAGSAPVIHCPPNMIPYGRLELPFVDQARRGAGEDLRRRYSCKNTCIFVYIQQYFAGGNLSGGFRFSACPWPFYNDGASSGKPFGQLSINDSLDIHRVIIRKTKNP